MRGERWAVGLLLVGLPVASEAGRGNAEPVLPAGWTWSVTGTRAVETTAEGAGAAGLPEALAVPQSHTVAWTLAGHWTEPLSDGSLVEWLRVNADHHPMDARVFGIRKFRDGEVLKVERAEEVSPGGLDGWDPLLPTLSPALPEDLRGKKPVQRAVQWTFRYGTADYLRTACPATWTLLESAPPAGAVGVSSAPLVGFAYEGGCTLNGRMGGTDGVPVPMRGTGAVRGEVWLDVDAGIVVDHTLSLQRNVHSRWPGQNAALELIQAESFTLHARWSAADSAPPPAVPLARSAVEAAIPGLLDGWSACASGTAPHELTVEAQPDGGLRVVQVRRLAPPTDAEPAAAVAELSPVVDCWQASERPGVTPPHDDGGARFSFVLPWRDGRFGAPGVVDQAPYAPNVHFVIVDDLAVPTVLSYLGMRVPGQGM